MKINFPLYHIRHGAVGGVENAAINLLDGLTTPLAQGTSCAVSVQVGSDQVLSPDLAAMIAQRPDLAVCRRTPGLMARRFPERYKRFAQETGFARETSGAADVTIFANYFCPPVRNAALGRRSVIVHDMQHRILPEYFPRSKKLWLEAALRLSFASADDVVFISETMREQARALYPGHDRGNWRVVHNAVYWDDLDQLDTAPAPTRPFLLSVCHHMPHKNLDTLLHGFALLIRKRPDLRLVLAGQPAEIFAGAVAGRGEPLAQLIARLDLSAHVVLSGFVSRARLGALYRAADLFVYPSLYEGFGLTPVEALGLGTQVLISDLPVLKEVTHGYATPVCDYRNPQAWADAMDAALNAPTDAATRAQARTQMRAAYSPRTIASRLMEG